MKKSNVTISLMPVAFVLIIIFISINLSNYYEAIAQQSNKTKNTNATTTIDNSDTFSAIGTISSLVITVLSSESEAFNITNAFKVILTGEWNLNVHNGTVTNFAVNFLASPMDGSRGHIHQITNFKSGNNNNEDRKAVQLT